MSKQLTDDLQECWNCGEYVQKTVSVKMGKGKELKAQVCRSCNCPFSFADLIVFEKYEEVTGEEIFKDAVPLKEMRAVMQQRGAPYAVRKLNKQGDY